MTGDELPAAARLWLVAAEWELRHADARERDETLEGLRSHIAEALDRGERVEDILAGLGSPADVADGVDRKTGDLPGPQVAGEPVPARTRRRRVGADGSTGAGRVVHLIGFGLALLGAGWFSLLPGYVESTIDPATGQISGPTTHLLLFTMDPRAAGALAAAVLLTVVPLLVRRRPVRPVAVWIGALMVLLAVATTGWNVGWFLLPAAAATVVAAVLPNGSRKRRRRDGVAAVGRRLRVGYRGAARTPIVGPMNAAIIACGAPGGVGIQSGVDASDTGPARPRIGYGRSAEGHQRVSVSSSLLASGSTSVVPTAAGAISGVAASCPAAASGAGPIASIA